MNTHQLLAAPQVNHPSTKPLMTIKEFHAHFAGTIGINSIRAAVTAGRIHSISMGVRKRLIPSSEIEAWPRREIEAAKFNTN